MIPARNEQTMRYIISIDASLCTGCRICEMVCSLSHTGACWPERARLRVVTEEADGRIDSVPILCMQCEVPACRLACPTGATFEGGPAGARLVASEKCIGCSACVWACPFGASALDPVTQVAFRCDQCEGDPLCVRHCPTGALKYVQEETLSMAEQRRKLGVFIDLQRLIRG
jgi:Fe-S-cluster-containing dehydrogenase component